MFHLRELFVGQSAARPYLAAGLGIAVAVCGYLFVRRRAKHPVLSPQPDALSGLVMVLTAAPTLSTVTESTRGTPLRKYGELPANIQNIGAQKPYLAVPQGREPSKQWQLISAAFKAWMDDHAASMGAALSYYTIFSLAPLLVIVIALAGMLYGEKAAQGEIVVQLRGTIGAQGALAVEELLKAVRQPTEGVVATVVGMVILLLGATAVFAELQSALDRIWRVPVPPEESGVWHLLRTRLLSFGLVIGLGLMLCVSLAVSAVLPTLGHWASGWFEGSESILEIFNFVASTGIFTLLFAMVYKIMPRATVPWRVVWIGAAVTALLFSIGKMLIGLYIYKSSLASGFGAAGSFIVLFAWVYYSAQIFLFGAEYTWVYANQFLRAGMSSSAQTRG